MCSALFGLVNEMIVYLLHYKNVIWIVNDDDDDDWIWNL